MITKVTDGVINDGIASSVVNLGEHRQAPLYQYWPVGSYIPWHNDGYHKAAITIYLTEHDKDDGGYFMYDDGHGIKAVMPKPNRAVFVTGGLSHCVTTVNQGSPIRRTIQVWLS
jgi:Rps23 Pro-64 3,4-dihydroxylase Tpa1-like proline 4-hydroxylase